MKQEFIDYLKKEILEIRDRYPHISEDNAFGVWFMRAFVTDDEESAVHSIKGSANDKGNDSIYFDHDNRIIFIVQCKYHQKSIPNTPRQDIIALSDIGRSLVHERKEAYKSILNKANSLVKDALIQARKLIFEREYQLVLQFVTTGKVSTTHLQEAKARLEEWDNVRFDVFANTDLNNLMQDYIEGAAPPVPSIKISLPTLEGFNRKDTRIGINSWIFTLSGKEVGKLYNQMGIRIFSRNIRGYLGNTEINRVMKNTIEKESEYFWYYNNGITIVCDDIKRVDNYLRVKNAQIINGQQTTRTLATIENNSAEVLVKLIEIKRQSENDKNKFRHIISEIVSATNWQNAISQSDLKSNDAEQVRIEKEFKKLNYFYRRKKMSKSELVKYGANKYSFRITKEHLSQAIAAVDLDPYNVREGINRLFEDDIYSKIFNGRKAVDYLTIYWIYRLVNSNVRVDYRFRYAKWPVLNFVWHLIGDNLNKLQYRDKFRRIAEREKHFKRTLNNLDRLIINCYKFALLFYSKNKKVEGKIKEPIDFFKHPKLHFEMRKFFTHLPKKYKSKFEDNTIRFKEALDKLE